MPVKVGLKYIEQWQESMEDTVLEYEKEPLHKGQIVFYGPSYFTRWGKRHGMVPLREALTGASGAPCVVNRGFGSSCAEHQLYYYPRLIRPLEPAVLVYTCRANGPSFGYSEQESWELGQRVIAWAKTDFPNIEIVLVGAHPSRDMTPRQREEARAYNAMVQEFAERTPNCRFLDVLDYEPLQDKALYVEDGVHFNQSGYRAYEAFYRQALHQELSRY